MPRVSAVYQAERLYFETDTQLPLKFPILDSQFLILN